MRRGLLGLPGSRTMLGAHCNPLTSLQRPSPGSRALRACAAGCHESMSHEVAGAGSQVAWQPGGTARSAAVLLTWHLPAAAFSACASAAHQETMRRRSVGPWQLHMRSATQILHSAAAAPGLAASPPSGVSGSRARARTPGNHAAEVLWGPGSRHAGPTQPSTSLQRTSRLDIRACPCAAGCHAACTHSGCWCSQAGRLAAGATARSLYLVSHGPPSR